MKLEEATLPSEKPVSVPPEHWLEVRGGRAIANVYPPRAVKGRGGVHSALQSNEAKLARRGGSAVPPVASRWDRVLLLVKAPRGIGAPRPAKPTGQVRSPLQKRRLGGNVGGRIGRLGMPKRLQPGEPKRGKTGSRGGQSVGSIGDERRWS